MSVVWSWVCENYKFLIALILCIIEIIIVLVRRNYKVVDSTKEYNAIREARKLGIPVFGLIDTNCDPDDVDYILPGNDDAVRSIKVVLGALTNAIIEANGVTIIDYVGEEDKKPSKEKNTVKKEKKRC